MRNRFHLLLWLGALSSTPLTAQTAHYLDCENGNDSLDSLTPQSAWKTVGRANQFTFQPGDSLLLKRRSVCTGLLAPKGSGTEAHPITLGAYGVGALPKIIGTGQPAGIRLDNQQYWEIAHLDVTGGNPYGIFITGTVPHLKHFRITDVLVHDVTGQPKTKQTGLVVIVTDEKAQTIFDDIVIDGVTAYNTTQWAGIIVTGGIYDGKGVSPRGSHIIIRNSIVHDVAGDGILLSLAKDGLIEHSVAWNTGMQHTESIGTPNAIWEWECDDCTVQYNEGFFSDSPGVDGGVFDIDWGCHNNVVQYNFAHDSQGYCASVFGAGGDPGSSTNNIIRRNLCLDNGRSPRLAQRQGAIYLSTWDGGHLSGVEIYNNTIIWDPPPDAPALVNEADIDPSLPHVFRNNLIVSRSPTVVRSTASLQLDGNQYWVPGAATPVWQYGSRFYTSIAALQAGGQEKHGVAADPRLGDLLEPTAPAPSCDAPHDRNTDLYGRNARDACDIGAIAPFLHSHREKPLGSLPVLAGGNPYKPDGWTLLAMLAPEGCPDARASRTQLVMLQSMLRQFATLGLHIDAIPSVEIDSTAASNWAGDWNFEKIRLLSASHPVDTRKALGIPGPPGIVLISPQGYIVRTWNGLVTSPEIELTLRSLLGVPGGMQQYR